MASQSIATLSSTDFNQGIRDYSLIVVGVVVAAFGLKGLLLPSHFIDGGITGISLLANKVTDAKISVLIFVLNIPFIIIGYHQISRVFALKTFVGISLLAIVLFIVEFPQVTNDKLLVAVFGGFFIGAGIGLCIRGGGVIDGTEVMALYISRKTSLSMGDVIMIINIFIFLVAAALINIESALYSMLTYFTASKTVDFVIQGIEEYTGLTIISEKSDEIRVMITVVCGRAVTIYKGERGLGKGGDRSNEIDIVFTVITRLELSKIKSAIAKVDPNAFIIEHSINNAQGGMIKRRPLH